MMAKKTGKSILNAAGARKYRMIAVSIALLCLLVSHTAYAQTTVPVPPGSTNLVVDTMTYNGVTVSAIYRSYDGTNGDDSTYSCAALVSRFYREVFGVTVYDLWTSSSVPKVNSGSFSLTSSPVVGDIARNNSGTHWAIVKAVDGDTVTLFEQNSWYCYLDDQYNKAWKERFISKSNGTYSFFRWSGLIVDTTALAISNIQVSNVSPLGYTVTCNVDNVGVTRVAFPTWTTENYQDDIVWQDGTLSNGVATFRVNISDHGNQSGEYMTFIYAYDAAGNHTSDSEAGAHAVTVNVPELKAQVDRGQDGVYHVGETVHISLNDTSFSSATLHIIKTPTGGVPEVDTYVYWEGNIQGTQYDLALTEDGYYACCFILSNGNQNITSKWVGWLVWNAPDLFLPAALTTIESQAFSGFPAKAVVIPKTVTGIASDAFSGSSITLIYGYADSAAETFCTNHAGFTFVEIDDAWMARH